MASINKSHIEENGGVLLFNGELVLLYCDSVSCEVGGKESFKGRVYLTTHRLVVVITPFRQNATVKSFCAPFCAITKCGVEQPVFGANYIEATVRDEADQSKFFSFKLKFSKGGAIELAMAMNRAVQLVGRNFNASMPPPPAYTPSPSAQYYQAPPTVYAPGYNSGVPMPTQQFPDQPPIGFIYASEAPPPYPGIGDQANRQANPQPPGYQPQQIGGGGGGGYPGQQPSQSGGYPGQQPSQSGGYPGQQPAQQNYSWPGNNPGAGYPRQQQSQQPWGGYPGQQQPTPTPSQPQPPPQQQQAWTGYPQGPATAPSGYPSGSSQSQTSAGYPDLSGGAGGYPTGPQATVSQQEQQQQQQQYPHQQQPQQGGAWPTAPSFNPNWQDDNKNA